MKTIKNILSYFIMAIGGIILSSTSLFGLAYTSQTNGEEMHRRACGETFEATGMIHVVFEDDSERLGVGTATLIAPDVIITAAHIFKHQRRPNSKVLAVGFQAYDEASLDSEYIPKTECKPKNIWIHPNYDILTVANDIAIVRLASPVKYIRPAELQKTLPSDLSSASATIVGYGYQGSKHRQVEQIFDQKRRAGDIDISQDSMDSSMLCSPKYAVNNQDGSYIINPKDSKHRAFLAFGDSGGPVFIKVNGETYPRIVGINSGEVIKSSSARRTESIDKFASISYYYEWIESKLKLCGASPYNANEGESITMDYQKSGLGNLFDSLMNFVKSTDKVSEKAVRKDDRNEVLSQESLKLYFDSWYDYLASVEYSDSFGKIVSSISEQGSGLFYEYIEVHKQLYLSLWE